MRKVGQRAVIDFCLDSPPRRSRASGAARPLAALEARLDRNNPDTPSASSHRSSDAPDIVSTSLQALASCRREGRRQALRLFKTDKWKSARRA